MKKLFLSFLLIFVIFQSCKQNSSQGQVVETIKSRENYENPNTILLSDTTQSAFNQIVINDLSFKKKIIKETKNFYQQNGFKTRWLYKNQPSALFYQYMKVLEKTADYGLNPETYQYSFLQKSVDSLYLQNVDFQKVSYFDKQLTASFLLLTNHLGTGRIDKLAHGKFVWIRNKKNRDDVEILLKIEENENLSEIIEALHPQHILYKRMAEKYKSLKINQLDSFKEVVIPNLKEFAVGYSHSSIADLRYNLRKRGFETISQVADNQVDSTLIEAITRFQKARGLQADGIPGKTTLAHLSMSSEREMDLLRLNMERMRWLNNDMGENYIVVNIPDFQLFMYHKDSIIERMNVIVGKEYTATPVIIDTLKYVEFRPTWTVPPSIMKNEMIPQIVAQSDPEKYLRRGYTLYENGKKIDPKSVDWLSPNIHKRNLRFIEAPSARNSLGLVKFILTNDMSIYLHDTPSPHLFGQENRALSHGCVRVEKPAELAYLLLKNQDDWTREKVAEAMNSGRDQHRIKLKTKYLVNILYLTAWVDENNEIVIKNDIYGFDQEQLKELNKYN